MNETLPEYALLSAAFPARWGGWGCNLLAWNWTLAVGGQLRLIVTRGRSPAPSSRVEPELPGAPVITYPDLEHTPFLQHCYRVRKPVEATLFLGAARPLARHIRQSGANRIFAFFGGDPAFLLPTFVLAWLTSLPIDVYLVDDLEHGAGLSGGRLRARVVRFLEPRVLRRAARIFTISPGYAEHIQHKYGLSARWLPIHIDAPPEPPIPFRPLTPDVRRLTFSGGVSPLYEDALQEIREAVAQWNASQPPFRLRLHLLTYTDPAYVHQRFGPCNDIDLDFRPNPERMREALQSSWAILMPYSFCPRVRLTTQTSFPTKLIEAFRSGRPMLIYAPPSSSIARYARSNQIGWLVDRREDLIGAFRALAACDPSTQVARHQVVYRRYHDARAIRAILADIPSTPIPDQDARSRS